MTLAVESTVTLDLVRLVAFLLGFLLCGGLVRLAWDSYRTRAETKANGLVLTGVTAFCLGTCAVVIASLSHVTDKVHRANAPFISPLLIGAFLVMTVGLFLVIRGQRERVTEASQPYRGTERRRNTPPPVADHPLDDMAADAQERNSAG